MKRGLFRFELIRGLQDDFGPALIELHRAADRDGLAVKRTQVREFGGVAGEDHGHKSIFGITAADVDEGDAGAAGVDIADGGFDRYLLADMRLKFRKSNRLRAKRQRGDDKSEGEN